MCVGVFCFSIECCEIERNRSRTNSAAGVRVVLPRGALMVLASS